MTTSTSQPGLTVVPPKKKGRPRKPYVTSDGKHINGLRKTSDGRWHVVDTGDVFTEHDEKKAIFRAKQIIARHTGRRAFVQMPHDETDRVAAGAAASGQPAMLYHADAIDGEVVYGHFSLVESLPESALWAWFREQLLTRPNYVAEQVGIPEVGRLSDLPRRGPSPSLELVGQTYFDHAAISDHERTKSKTFWSEFTKVVGVSNLRQIETAHVAAYYDKIIAADMSPTYVAHRFGKVKSIIAFAKKRGLDVIDCRTALDACAVLVPPPRETADPRPIDRQVFHTLLDIADAKMKAVLLLALNCCMYGAEVADLLWTDIKSTGVVITTRGKSMRAGKKAITRAAVLWPETIAALDAIRPLDVEPFTRVVGHWNANIINKAFYDLRETAKIGIDVKFNHVRDGAYTAAVEDKSVQFEHAQVLAGHRCGIADKYIARRPKMVDEACAAIHAAYMA